MTEEIVIMKIEKRGFVVSGNTGIHTPYSSSSNCKPSPLLHEEVSKTHRNIIWKQQPLL